MLHRATHAMVVTRYLACWERKHSWALRTELQGNQMSTQVNLPYIFVEFSFVDENGIDFCQFSSIDENVWYFLFSFRHWKYAADKHYDENVFLNEINTVVYSHAFSLIRSK